MSQRDESPARKVTKSVFVVFKSESYEGGSILGVHESKESAIQYCEKVVAEHQRSKRPWKRIVDTWTSGIDTIDIQEWEVL